MHFSKANIISKVPYLISGRLEVWFLKLPPEIFYTVKTERKRDRNTPIPTLLMDFPVTMGEMAIWVYRCAVGAGCLSGRAVPVRCEVAFCGAVATQGNWDGRAGMSFSCEASLCRHKLAGSQLSQLNLQRNCLPFGELPDTTDTLKYFFFISAVQQKELPQPTLRAKAPSSSVTSFKMWVMLLLQDSPFTSTVAFSSRFPGMRTAGETECYASLMGEILCTAILVLTACCGHQALSSARFQGDGKEVGCTEALTLEQYKSRRVMRGVCLSCKQWTVCKRGSFMQWWGCGKWETTN